MDDYHRVKWAESEDGALALEVLQHPRGHARFSVYRRHPRGAWRQVQDSKVYDNPIAAEHDARLAWTQLPKSYFSGMTPNERLFDLGLLPAFDAALAARDRRQLIAILTQVELEDHADRYLKER